VRGPRPGTDEAAANGESCRSETASPVDSLRWLPAALFVLFVVANVAVRLYLRHCSVRHRFDAVPVEFGLFTGLLGAVVGVAAAAGLYFGCALVGLMRLARGISALTVLSWIAVVLVVGGSVLGALFLAAATAPASVDRTLAIQTRPITLVTALCVLPGLLGFMAVRSLARDDACWAESGACRLRLLIRLRAEVRRLLVVLGALLTLIVVTTGMRRRALLALDTRLHVPAEEVLLYGLIFAVLLGVFFLAASSALDTRAALLVDEFAPLPDPAAAAISEQIGRRNDLGGLVGLGGSWRTFESVVVVAAPLLTALIGSATSA